MDAIVNFMHGESKVKLVSRKIQRSLPEPKNQVFN